MDVRTAAALGLAVAAVGLAIAVAGGGIGGLLATDGYEPVTATGNRSAGADAAADAGGSPTPTATGPGATARDPTARTATDPRPTSPRTDATTDATRTTRATPVPTFDDGYERATVTVRAANGTRLGGLQVALAETYRQKYTGLSETEHLPENRGMLFVYGEPGNHTFVMREMSFGIDIVYVDADGTITQIHHAPEPPPDEDGETHRYPGYGQYVLEVNLGWTTRRGVTVGDRIEIDRGI